MTRIADGFLRDLLRLPRIIVFSSVTRWRRRRIYTQADDSLTIRNQSQCMETIDYADEDQLLSGEKEALHVG